MTDTKLLKAENNESGTFTALVESTEVTTAYVSPTPKNAPGIIVYNPGEADEEHIFYREKDDALGVISGLVRDIENQNGGVGRQIENQSSWETLQSFRYVNNIIDVIIEGYFEETNDIDYVNASTFTVKTNRAAFYTKGRALRFSDGTLALVSSNANYDSGSGLTTVVVDNTVPSNLSSVEIGIQSKGRTSVLAKASGSEVNTGTDDEKFVTPKAITDSNLAFLSDIPIVLNDTWIDVADAATITLDLSNTTSRPKFRLGDLAGNRILAVSNPASGKVVIVAIPQDGTGSRTITAWPNISISPVTVTIATPGVITSNKDLRTGTPVKFSTTGALPTGITAGTVYYWIRTSATTGNIASSLANAQAGTTIATSGSQSGTHSMTVEIRWAGGSAPTLSTGKYQVDYIGLIFRSAEMIDGFVIGQDV